MRICLLEPACADPRRAAHLEEIDHGLERLGYEVYEQDETPDLFRDLWEGKPDLVFNLSSVYDWEKGDLVPAVLEVAGVPYTGSGALGLSLARHYTHLFPLLSGAGIATPRFVVTTAGQPRLDGLCFPILVRRDGSPEAQRAGDLTALRSILSAGPAQEKVLLQEETPGEIQSLFLIGPVAFTAGRRPATAATLAAARKAYATLEARGLARFDFTVDPPILLVGIDLAPDPLAEPLVRAAAGAGWDSQRILQTLVKLCAQDRTALG